MSVGEDEEEQDRHTGERIEVRFPRLGVVTNIGPAFHSPAPCDNVRQLPQKGWRVPIRGRVCLGVNICRVLSRARAFPLVSVARATHRCAWVTIILGMFAPVIVTPMQGGVAVFAL